MSKVNKRMTYKDLKEIFVVKPDCKKLWFKYKFKHIESRMFGKGIVVGMQDTGLLILKLDVSQSGSTTYGWDKLDNHDYAASAHIGVKSRYYYVDVVDANDDIELI